MATATGWGALPISLSFGDSIKSLVAELNGPVAKAAKNAGGSIEKEIGNASKQAADRYEKQKWRMEKAAKEHTAAEEQHRLKLLEQERAQTALENAEKDLADAREAGGKKARDAQLRYENAQIKVEKATIATRKASDKLDDSINEVSRAGESAEQAFQDMEKAQDDAGDSAKGFRDLVREMGDELDETGEKAAGFGDKVISGLGTIGKGALLGVGAKIGTTVMSGVGTAFSKGFGRLQSLEDAEASLEGLGRSSQDIETIMDSVSQSVTGTAFGLDEAAKSAATFSTLGVESGEEMDRVMSLLADTTAQSGGELSEISPILSKIVAAGGLNIETYDQLNERATGVGEALSKHLGIPIEEVRDNLADVDFDTFATAMESNIGGAAKKSGETFGNAFGNMQAALGRLGEKFLEPAFEMGPAVFGAIGGAFDKMGEELEPVIEQVTEYLAPIMEEFAQKLGPWLVDTIEDVSQGIKDVVGWIRENADWLKALAVGVGIAVGAWKLFTGAMKLHGIAITIADKGWKAYIASTKIATAVTKLFNKATKANVIGLIATALIAVGGALIYFFTQTETGRELWEKFTNFLSDAWQKVSEKFAEAIDWISEKWDSFTSFMSELWETIKTSVFDAWTDTIQGVRDGWDEFTGAISDSWEWLKDTLVNVWTTVRDAVFFAFMWYVNRVKANFELVTGAINTAWTWLKDGLLNVWNTIRDKVVNAFVNAWNNLRAGFDIVMGALSSAWTFLRDGLVNVWNTIKDTVVNAFINAWDNLRAKFDHAMELIGNAWQFLKDTLWAGYDWIRANVFDKFKSSLDTVEGWFQTAVDGITRIWDKIRSAAAKPVKFIVDTVYNGGIRKAWNAVARFVNLDELDEIPLGDLGNFASGGILPGYTPGRDPYTFIEPTTGMRIGLSGGEAIVRPEATRVLGSGWVDGINAAAKTGGAAGVSKFLGGFANGGIVESISAAVRKQFPMMTITSTYRNTNDHHGAGRAVDFSNGTDSTPQMRAAAQWFYANYGPGLLELIHSPFNNNVKDGANVGDGFGFYGAGTMNQHRNHVHVAAPAPLGDPSVMVEMMEDAGGSGFSLGGMVKGLWDKAIGAVGKWTGGGLIGGLPGAMLSTLASSAWDFVSERVGQFFGAGGNAGNAESWREMAVSAMRRNGFDADDPAQVNAMLAQIMSESGGDPGIAQQIVDVNGTGESAGVGLLQIIPGTFAAHRDPELPDDRRDPWANMNAALRYYRSRYGTDLTTMWGKGHGYADGGVVDLPSLFDAGGVWRDGTMGVNLSGSDEVVFNNRQWQLLKQVLNTVPALTDSQEMMVKELGAAFLGGDVGYAELANALGSEKLAQQVTDIAFLMGEVSRDTEVMAAAAEFNEQARKSGEDYVAEQAGGFLSTWGLEGLVPLAQKAGGMAWDAYVANPVDVAMTPNGVTAYARKQGVQAEVNRGGATVTIEAESDEDLIRVSQFKQLASQVDWLKVKVERKPKAGARTRGGVM